MVLKKKEENTSKRSAVSHELALKDAHIETLRKQLSDAVSSEKQIADEFNRQISIKNQQLEQLMGFLARKDIEVQKLTEQLEGQKATEQSYVERLKRILIQRDSTNKGIFKSLTKQLSEKDREIERLRELLLVRRNAGVAIPDIVPDDEVRLLERRLVYKNRELKKLEARFYERKRENERLVNELRKQLNERYAELEQLRRMIEQERASSQSLEIAFDRQLAEKESRICELQEKLDEQRHPKDRLTIQIAELKEKLNIKEKLYSELQAEVVKLKEQNTLLLRKFEVSKRFARRGESNYHKLIEQLNARYQKRIKELINRDAENESKLRAELEQQKIKLKSKERLYAEKEEKIDRALERFALQYKNLTWLRGGQAIAEQPSQIEERENKIKSILNEAESRVKTAIEKEASVERRELLLLKEQEAINKQLDILKAAGAEIGKTKEYIKKKLSEVDSPPEKYASAESRIESMADSIDELPKAETAVEALKPEVIEPEKAAHPFPKREEEFFKADSYSEMDEIKSMMEVALQHGDSEEQIRQSLLDSGYPKANVEKALRELKTVSK